MQRPEIRILIAERNPRMRDFLRREFSKQEFKVDSAANGEELFSKLNADGGIHLVVLAANTPGNSGGVLLQQLVADFPDIPVILNTYLEDLPDDPVLQRVAAMVDKNENPEKLTRMVTRVLERYYPDFVGSDRLEGRDV